MVDRRLYGFRFDSGELRRAQRIRTITNPGFLSGHHLADYLLLDTLGRGGMSEVYQAQRSGQLFAVKVLHSDLAEDATARARFEREATTMRTLDHPHIVKVRDAGETETLRYIAMDYINGVNLKSLMHSEEQMELPVVTEIIDDVASALDYAHGRGLVHRDVKPSNIMLTRNENGYHPYLMDFGIAKIKDEATDLTGTGAVGTIDYMAPEQIESARSVDHRADIYALGMVIYEMLTGTYPFQGSSASILFSHLQQPVPDPRLILPGLPAAAAEAILRALAKDPDNRFNSAGDLAMALHLAQV
jgi:serine/threonine-protein kinase